MLSVKLLGWFQSQGRFFGGCCSLSLHTLSISAAVSIAGAILWGVLHCKYIVKQIGGGVSIAGAILWGVLHNPPALSVINEKVSIAGAILWGVLPLKFINPPSSVSSFNRRGDSLGGAARRMARGRPGTTCFNRRGDSLGGAARLIFRYHENL